MEETDELFEAHLKWGWQFSSYRTIGTGAKIAALQNDDSDRLRRLSSVAVPNKEDGFGVDEKEL